MSDTVPAPRPRRTWWRRVLRAGRQHSRRARHRGPGWRLLTPTAFAGAGVLLVTSAVNSGGTDLRHGRFDDLAGLVRQENDRVRELREREADLRREVQRLSAQVDGDELSRLERISAREAVPAGLTAMEGPGLTVQLEDAPEEMRESAGTQVANTIVHQQDIQAVVNALWKGGAEAMTLQGQRVVSTTGIKCVGNTVLLHGVTYSPPYVISAIGDPDALQASLDESRYVQSYLQAVDQWQLGWDVAVEERILAPAFDGATEMRHARPAS